MEIFMVKVGELRKMRESMDMCCSCIGGKRAAGARYLSLSDCGEYDYHKGTLWKNINKVIFQEARVF